MSLFSSLRALAALLLPRGHHIERGCAAQGTAIRAGRSEISSGNERGAGQNGFALRSLERLPPEFYHAETSSTVSRTV